MPTWRKGLWNIIITLCPSLFLSVTFTSTFQSSALKTLGTNVTRNWIYFFLLEIPHRNQRFPHGVRKDIFCHFCGVLFSAFFFLWMFCFYNPNCVLKKNSWVIQTWVSLKLIYYNLQISSGSCCYFSTFKDLYLFHL